MLSHIFHIAIISTVVLFSTLRVIQHALPHQYARCVHYLANIMLAPQRSRLSKWLGRRVESVKFSSGNCGTGACGSCKSCPQSTATRVTTAHEEKIKTII